MSLLRKKSLSGLILVLIALVMTMLVPKQVLAQEEDGWPRVIDHAKGKITIYQPQVEVFKGNILEGRAAVSVVPKGKTEPVFGAVWLKARVETDRDERTVSIEDLKIPNVRFPEATKEQEKELAQLLTQEIPQWDLTLSLDRLVTDLELAEKEQASAKNLKNDPPKVIIKTSPAVLISLDGDPILEDIENSKLKQVVNSPNLIVYDAKKKKYYLNGGEIWMVASDVLGPWKEEKRVPKEVAKLTPPEEEYEEGTDDRIPEIVVTTEAAELIVIDGTPNFASVLGGELLYVENSESDIIMEVTSQKYFILLSGRWYASKSLSDEGPWSYVPADELPESFAKIPEDSINGHVLPHVAGTEQAKDAVLDAQIPQTSAIDRNDKSLTVEYDGKPKFEKIEDTDMEYAANTASAIFKVEGRYYCCDEAVWYEADRPEGPWAVCVKVPDEIYTIPPSNPHYNVKYVYVYDSTPDVVYVGYYPGYYGSYVYGGTVVWGTGWWYSPWRGRYYYPRFRTWGFGVRWSPWRGWSFGFGYGRFGFSIGFGRGRGGWWGPGRHRSHRRGYRSGYRAGRRDSARSQQRNTYKRQENTKRNVTQQKAQQQKKPQAATGQSNNVFADKNGNVHRKTESGNWQSRDNGKWSSTKDSGTKSQMESRNKTRQRGTTRTQRSRSSRSRGGGRRR